MQNNSIPTNVEIINDSNYDVGNVSDLEEIVSPVDVDYEANYPPLTRWTRGSSS